MPFRIKESSSAKQIVQFWGSGSDQYITKSIYKLRSFKSPRKSYFLLQLSQQKLSSYQKGWKSLKKGWKKVEKRLKKSWKRLKNGWKMIEKGWKMVEKRLKKGRKKVYPAGSGSGFFKGLIWFRSKRDRIPNTEYWYHL